MGKDHNAANLLRRLWAYQAERFPVVAHGVLIAAFAGSAVCLSALLRNTAPSWHGFAVAFGVLFLLFFQLRVADEHKDFADDSRYRPERAVPRGLVTLRELRNLGLAAAAAQLLLVSSLDTGLLVLLAITWAWLALMTVEFFVADWLKARPLLYMMSHMIIMPSIALFATACDWLPATGSAANATAIVMFLGLSFCSGAAIEIARKCRAPQEERDGVETYSALWGYRRAGMSTALAVTVAFGLGIGIHHLSGARLVALAVLAAAWLYAFAMALAYAKTPSPARSKQIETSAGVFVLGAYLALGPLALGATLWMN